jgi:Fe-S-cluster containining protein
VTPSQAITALQEVYQALEQRPPQRDCRLRSECCHFRLTGKTPLVTQVETLYAVRGVKSSGRKKLIPHPNGACPCLGKDQRCTIYNYRPFGCRTHFCAAAGGPYSRKEVQDLVQRLESLDEALGYHEGSRPFVAALDAVLQQKEPPRQKQQRRDKTCR